MNSDDIKIENKKDFIIRHYEELVSRMLDEEVELVDECDEWQKNFFIACTLLDMHCPLVNGNWWDLIMDSKKDTYS